MPHSHVFTTIDGTFSSLGDFSSKIADADLANGLLYVQPDDVGVLRNGTHAECASQEILRSTNRMRMMVMCPSPSVLAVNEFFDSAWKAAVDGKRVRILRINGNQMAAQIPPGSHLVEFRYQPKTFFASIPIALIGAALLACLMVFSKFAAGRRKRGALNP